MRKRDDKNIECILKLEKVLTKSKVCTILVFPEYGLVEIPTRVICSLFVHKSWGGGRGCLLGCVEWFPLLHTGESAALSAITTLS